MMQLGADDYNPTDPDNPWPNVPVTERNFDYNANNIQINALETFLQAAKKRNKQPTVSTATTTNPMQGDVEASNRQSTRSNSLTGFNFQNEVILCDNDGCCSSFMISPPTQEEALSFIKYERIFLKLHHRYDLTISGLDYQPNIPFDSPLHKYIPTAFATASTINMVTSNSDFMDALDWKFYAYYDSDDNTVKYESIIPLLLALTVKSIQQNEEEKKLNLSATITLKLPIRTGLTLEHVGNLSPAQIQRRMRAFLIAKKDDVKEYMKNISLNINQTENKNFEPRNCKVTYDEKNKNFSSSGHLTVEIPTSSITDYCPYNLAEYNLSLKLNAVDCNNHRQKVKYIWDCRTPKEFLEFQYSSLKTGITVDDFISIEPRPKDALRLKEFQDIPQAIGTKLEFYPVLAETDELVFCFHTKNDEIKNFTNIVLPCTLVPIIIALSADKENLLQLLLGALLAIVFTMPTMIETSTCVWYLVTMVLVIIAYSSPSSREGVQIATLPIFFVLLMINFILQVRTSRRNKIRLSELVKGGLPENPIMEWRTKLGLYS